ncbi:MAG: TonB-dependent receptor [Gammaproteobacteria bacterium]|nr:TonB-dependent receptor [Gammaproteobacteria bacterium]
MKMKHISISATVSGILFLFLSTTFVQGQELQLEEIVVTAQKRSEALQDVPIQVSAYTSETIAAAGITSTQDFINLTPNMSLDDSDTYHNTFVVMRGVAQTQNTDSPVAIVVDGVPQNDQKQLKMHLFDIERIEVLKGPQGALYGRNAIGGAVNIITRAPTTEPEGYIKGSYGNGEALDLTAGISGTLLDDKLLVRLAGIYKEDNGRIHNDFLDTEVDFIDHDYAIRGRVQLLPTDWLTLDFRGMYNDFRAGSQWDTPVFSRDPNDFDEPEVNLRGFTYGEVKEFTFKFDAELDFATLTGITGYTEFDEINRGDLDFRNPVDSPGGFFGAGFGLGQGQDRFVELISQELRLVSPDAQPLRWLLGAYYINTKRDLQTRGFVDVGGGFGQIDVPGALLINRQESNDNDAFALFGELSFDLTDKVTLSAAIRYDEDNREQTDPTTGNVREDTFDSVQPKVTLTYQPADRKLVYATYSTGFRSGGFNAPGVPIDMFRDETLDNFEVGFKSSWANNRIIVNGAFYYTLVDDFQFIFFDVATAAQVLTNIEEVDIYGFELETKALLAPGLQFYAGVGTTDSEIKELTVFPGNNGNKAPKTTDWSLNAALQYNRTLSANVDGMFRIDFEHRGDRNWQVDGVAVQEPIDLVNLRLGLEYGQFGVYFWAKNLTDERYYTDYNSIEFTGLDVDIGYLAPPLSYGVETSYRF